MGRKYRDDARYGRTVYERATGVGMAVTTTATRAVI